MGRGVLVLFLILDIPTGVTVSRRQKMAALDAVTGISLTNLPSWQHAK